MGKATMNLPASKLPLVEEPRPDQDFRSSFHWRIFRIMAEFVDGWTFLADFKKSVTIFGSARFLPGTPWYEEGRKLGHMISSAGIDVITGGGPGAMEASNRGAYEAIEASGGPHPQLGDSIGLNIKLPFEQRINQYVTKAIAFHYFFVRKVMLSYYAQAYVFFPGGFGTLDETFELITLIQTRKISDKIPIILMGKDYWKPLLDWVEHTVYQKYQAIDKEDMLIYHVVDTAAEAMDIIKKAPERKGF